jgi:hypothetical protein
MYHALHDSAFRHSGRGLAPYGAAAGGPRPLGTVSLNLGIPYASYTFEIYARPLLLAAAVLVATSLVKG